VSDRLVDARAIAELLGVPISWVRDHTRSDEIPHVPLGRYVRYQEAVVLAWVDSIAKPGRTTVPAAYSGRRKALAPQERPRA
jgi:hypothetical protein